MRIRPAAITLALLALVAGLAAAALTPSSAAASTKPCWEQVIDDWLDNGTIDGHYKASCYQQALKRVPEDLRDYSNITDAISAALSDSLRGSGTGMSTTERGWRTTSTVTSRSFGRTTDATSTEKTRPL